MLSDFPLDTVSHQRSIASYINPAISVVWVAMYDTAYLGRNHIQRL
jgi:hypothetical protein